MAYSSWFGDTSHSKIVFISDDGQQEVASHLLENLQCKEGTIHNIEALGFDWNVLESLKEKDYVIVALSYKTFILMGYNQCFPTFRKPKELRCNYVFVRLDISLESLSQGLRTNAQKVQERIDSFCIKPGAKDEGPWDGSKVRVTAPGGTDISFSVNRFKHFNHFITPQAPAAFLPPSEIYGGILLGSANGQLVVDLTIGQLYKDADLLETFGLVDHPVTLTVVESSIVAIEGNALLKEHLMKLELEALKVVELGIGLAQMTATGNIGIDESLEGTCHFGIGDGLFYGIDNPASIHLDVVIKEPFIEAIIEE